jgi:hypothetical protein
LLAVSTSWVLATWQQLWFAYIYYCWCNFSPEYSYIKSYSELQRLQRLKINLWWVAGQKYRLVQRLLPLKHSDNMKRLILVEVLCM